MPTGWRIVNWSDTQSTVEQIRHNRTAARDRQRKHRGKPANPAPVTPDVRRMYGTERSSWVTLRAASRGRTSARARANHKKRSSRARTTAPVAAGLSVRSVAKPTAGRWPHRDEEITRTQPDRAASALDRSSSSPEPPAQRTGRARLGARRQLQLGKRRKGADAAMPSLPVDALRLLRQRRRPARVTSWSVNRLPRAGAVESTRSIARMVTSRAVGLKRRNRKPIRAIFLTLRYVGRGLCVRCCPLLAG